ncbi:MULTISPECIES: diaminopimelate epimerase [Flavobacteriaceae]|uniref:Diaminopimelate epimerase n=2 Tax=Flavobacteriaceae TaxID=49546 RepID=A0A4Y8AVR3_9FLAO|nr:MULTISPECIES: diaminopimelate epimerase [Flavobacteriaceae]TEW75436.1 diaminopimelate epimerase [Gramella jeungdoensis]GGK45179.1 diaminopimelate epimerase [Lutibacter litoralis]
MKLHFYKYQGAGNDFIMVDNRNLSFPKINTHLINKLCDRRFGIGADGLILLEPSKNEDFTMVYFNADGNEGSMCGNGGRCIVAFAKQLGIITDRTTFNAVDGLHYATIANEIVSLKMIDVSEIKVTDSYVFLNTGSPHHVLFSKNIAKINVKESGAKIRYGAPYFEVGTNVNFVEKITANSFKVRTYERGVEDETLACGTGVTAVAIAAHITNKTNENSIKVEVLGGDLEVSFEKVKNKYTNIFLKGPSQFVFEGKIAI